MEVGILSVHVVGRGSEHGGPKCSCSREREWRWES